ncbi:hypothetical protein GQ85_18710 [Rhodococcus rhodochrous]|nr:hypothetical protein GQ85_18710 [Rhodococcus rhodochrous]
MVSSRMSGSGNDRNTGTRSLRIGARRLPDGIASTAHQNTSAATTFGPYFGGRDARGRTTVGVSVDRKALRAWSRCRPVVAHNSSREHNRAKPAGSRQGPGCTSRRLYVEATLDRTVPLVAQREMQRLVPGARVVTLDTDHAPQLSARDELVDGIRQWCLSGLPELRKDATAAALP